MEVNLFLSRSEMRWILFPITPQSADVNKNDELLGIHPSETGSGRCIAQVRRSETVVILTNITVTSQWVRWRLKSPASRLFAKPFTQAQIKESSKLRVTGLCAGNSPVTGDFSAQGASNAKNVYIWWRHHEFSSLDALKLSECPVMLVPWTAPGHYLNQCWNIVNWALGNKFQWNLNRNVYIFIQEMHLKILSGKWRPFCLCSSESHLDGLTAVWPDSDRMHLISPTGSLNIGFLRSIDPRCSEDGCGLFC